MTTPGSASRLAQLVRQVPVKATVARNPITSTAERKAAGKLAPPGGNGVKGDQNESRKAN
ncbi:MAG TPA: hypothetical protein VKA02_06750 [Candidatus Acidoferrum sp.]|nr:hypothetical protein [Candidatus Acidoferrum sp.]